ncbi:MAG: TIGR01459 family HAD-type hydrolase, partial [Devosia sp.]
AVLILSNSGRRSESNVARLAALGFGADCLSDVLTSGESGWRHLHASLTGRTRQRCLLISRDADRSALEGLNLELTESGTDADIVLIVGSEGGSRTLDYYRDLLRPAAERGLPCICTNPDHTMLTPSGKHFGAGRIARVYEELGGRVTWFGKPFLPIYTTALAVLGLPAFRVLCVGDSVEHDIVGGAGAGMATLLVETGILDELSDDDRAALYRDAGIRPDFLLKSFAW